MAAPRPADWRAATLAFVLFGGVGLIFLFGAGLLGLSGADTAKAWLAVAQGPWALSVAIAAFAALAFLGVPQFVLIAAAVATFGPTRGAAYSWVGTMVSALIGFGLGRAWGARLLKRLSGETVTRILDTIARNGFIASLAIRLAPFAPFVVVNMAAGVSAVRVADFTAGTAIGILPKILLTAFAGSSIVAALGGRGLIPILLLVVAAAIWIGSGFLAGRWLKR
ncbi:MAG: TVP38/TMEM64 family protein [Caulobacteraceae bacterium]|nr:TVP38/TMEM64 family protein [Caulobacteraceae bacterium]